MKKTISITIGGLVFNVEEDAYLRLNAYLESLKSHFSAASYGSEIVADIESRIAEQFSSKISGNANRAVTDTDVEQIIKSIGSAEELGGISVEVKTTENPDKKLYRNSEDVVIAGVASGVAAYFGWDTTLTRVLFAVTVLLGGWGIFLYIILWIVMPVANTPGQKLEMQGKPVTLKQFEQTAKEKVNDIKNSSLPKQFFQTLGKIIKLFAQLISIVIGAVLAFASVVAAFFLTFGFANLLFNRNSPYIDPAVTGIFSGNLYYLVLVLGFITVSIPLIYLALGGISLIRRKMPINAKVASGMALLWLVAAIGTSVIALRQAPKIEAAVNEYKANVETRTVEASGFTKIDASSAYQFNVTQGKTYSVSIVGHSKDLDSSEIKVENGTLVVDRKNSLRFCFICFSDDVVVNVTTPNLNLAKGSGAVNYIVGDFKTDSLDIQLSGASNGKFTLTTSAITLHLSGASHTYLAGTAKSLDADLSGASRLDAFDMPINDANIHASGASRADINVTKTLDAEASGASRITYRGHPTITKQEDFGSSRIQPE